MPDGSGDELSVIIASEDPIASTAWVRTKLFQRFA